MQAEVGILVDAEQQQPFASQPTSLTSASPDGDHALPFKPTYEPAATASLASTHNAASRAAKKAAAERAAGKALQGLMPVAPVPTPGPDNKVC